MEAGESRVYLVHMATGAALVKRKSGDCPCDVEPLNNVLKSDDGMWKVECYGLDRYDRPNLVYIRNDWHPQRALNASGNLVNCSLRGSKDDELWHVVYSDEHNKSFALKNKKTQKYLAIRVEIGEYKVAFQDEPCYWFATLAKHAPSPGQVAQLVAVAPIAAVVAAISGGVGGIALFDVIGWGSVVMMTVGARAGGLAEIGKAINDFAKDPASRDWEVMEM